jgi:dimethylglycine dehydrogenase
LEWLQERVPVGADISIKSLVNDMTALVVAGPRSRAFLGAASPDTDFSKAAFPSLSLRRCYIGHVEATVFAVSYSGEVAFELHIPNNQLYAAYAHLLEIGESSGLTPFGTYAIESMRIEKGYGHWKADFITEYNPLESGLRRFVNFDKDFVGKAGLLEQKRRGLRRRRVLIAIDSEEGPAQPGDSIFQSRKAVGTVTSAAYGYRTAKNLAMAYIDPPHADNNAALTVTILGREVSASLVASPSLQYD